MSRERVVLRRGDAALMISPGDGGRIASLSIGEDELLVTSGVGPIWWGCYPMAPFAGRIGEGRFMFRGRAYQLERNLAPHAIHGTVLDRGWEVIERDGERAVLATELGPGWPFRGRVTHDILLVEDALEARLTLESDEPMPASIGWHPWFRRVVGGATAELRFAANEMYVRGPAGLPTGELRSPGPGPWDDAFTGVRSPQRLRWPGVLQLEIGATTDVWVVYDERPDAICVEPQTAPPDFVALAERSGAEPPTVEPGRPLEASMTWRWTRS